MITRIRIKNFRCFVDAEVKLQPFSLVVGANGSGKSNLLRFFEVVSRQGNQVLNNKDGRAHLVINPSGWTKHQNHQMGDAGCNIELSDDSYVGGEAKEHLLFLSNKLPWQGAVFPIFNIEPDKVSGVESTVPNATVKADGSGTVQVLDALKNGDREDLFNQIEENFRLYVPEVEKLSLRTVQPGTKQIQVREAGLKNGPLPATELSEGTRLILAILTILHQEKPPPMILLEDIDRGLHPRLFEYMAPLMMDIAKRLKVNILATTHNPYLVDCFKDDKKAVIIVEKKNGESTLATLASKLEGLDYDKIDPEDMPLGNLWFSGHVGGIPGRFKKMIER